MAIPKLPVILTEADWNKKKGKFAKLTNENRVGGLMAEVKVTYKAVRWLAFDVEQALRPTDTAEQILGQLLRAKSEYKKAVPLLKKLKELEVAAALAQQKFAKNKLIPKASAEHAGKVSKAAKLLAVQVQGVKAEYAAFEKAAQSKQPALYGEVEEVERVTEEGEKLVEVEGRPIEKETLVEDQEHRVFPETEEIQQRKTTREEEVIGRTKKRQSSKTQPRPTDSQKRKPLRSTAQPQFGNESQLSKAETISALLKDPENFTSRNFNLDLRGAGLAGANLANAVLGQANLSRANLTGANLNKAYLSQANLRRANLTNADLRDSNCRQVFMTGADLTGAHLGQAVMGAADLRDATLVNANLPGTRLQGAFLRRADLRGANLRGAILIEADLSGANLSNADLRGANLEKAKFSGATMDGANLTGAEGLTVDQLSKAKSAKGVIFPDGGKNK